MQDFSLERLQLTTQMQPASLHQVMGRVDYEKCLLHTFSCSVIGFKTKRRVGQSIREPLGSQITALITKQ